MFYNHCHHARLDLLIQLIGSTSHTWMITGEPVHLLPEKAGMFFLTLVSAPCTLVCRWHHLLPKSTNMQRSYGVITFLAQIQFPYLWPTPDLPIPSASKTWAKRLAAPKAWPGWPQLPPTARTHPSPNKSYRSMENRGWKGTLNPTNMKTFLLPGKRLSLCPGISSGIL